MDLSFFILALTVFTLAYKLWPKKYFIFFSIPFSVLIIAQGNLGIIIYLLLVSAVTILFAHFIRSNKKPDFILGTGIVLQIILLISGHLNKNTSNQGYSFLQFSGYAYFFTMNISFLIQTSLNKNLKSSNYFLSQFWFPRMINGPITEPLLFSQLLTNNEKVNYQLAFLRLIKGLFKILVLAGNLKISCQSVFDNNAYYSGLTSVAASVLYAIELYFEFSGYIDIVLAFTLFCGINLNENFNYPFKATNMQEFWQRWHISLTNWLTQYVFVPVYKLISKKINKALAASICIFLVFLSMGIWNGIKPGFIISGALFGLFSIISFIQNRKNKTKNANWFLIFIKQFIVLLQFSFCLFFFRNPDWMQTKQHLNLILNNFIPYESNTQFIAPLANGGTNSDLILFFTTTIFSLIFLVSEERIDKSLKSEKFPFIIAFTLIILCIVFGQYANNSVFEYMQVR